MQPMMRPAQRYARIMVRLFKVAVLQARGDELRVVPLTLPRTRAACDRLLARGYALQIDPCGFGVAS